VYVAQAQLGAPHSLSVVVPGNPGRTRPVFPCVPLAAVCGAAPERGPFMHRYLVEEEEKDDGRSRVGQTITNQSTHALRACPPCRC
jgi:hypothetical protein